MRNFLEILRNKRGNAILGYLIVTPFIVYFMLYIILGGAYFLRVNDMTNVVNMKLDRALVEGQFTTTLRDELENELDSKGFGGADLTINISPSVAGDSNNTSYAKRGEEIEITVLYKKPHYFYYPNRLFSPSISESKFYIGAKISGMSEKW